MDTDGKELNNTWLQILVYDFLKSETHTYTARSIIFRKQIDNFASVHLIEFEMKHSTCKQSHKSGALTIQESQLFSYIYNLPHK